MSVDKNVRIVDQWAQAHSTQDWERFESKMSDSVVYDVVGSTGTVEGQRNGSQVFRESVGDLPRCKHQKNSSIRHGEWVCWQGTGKELTRGRCDLRGDERFPPSATGSIFWLAIVFKFDKERIVAAQDYWDLFSMLTQLGIAL